MEGTDSVKGEFGKAHEGHGDLHEGRDKKSLIDGPVPD